MPCSRAPFSGREESSESASTCSGRGTAARSGRNPSTSRPRRCSTFRTQVSEAVVVATASPSRRGPARPSEEAVHGERRGLPGVRSAASAEGRAGPGHGRRRKLGAAIPLLREGHHPGSHRTRWRRRIWRGPTSGAISSSSRAPAISKGRRAALAKAERLDPQLAETHLFRYQMAWSHYQGLDIEARPCVSCAQAQKLDPLVGPRAAPAILYAHLGLDGALSTRGGARPTEVDPTSASGPRGSASRDSCSSVFPTRPWRSPADRDFAVGIELPMSLMSTGRDRRDAGRDGGAPEGGPGPPHGRRDAGARRAAVRKSEPSTKRRSRGRARRGRRSATITTQRTPSPASDRPRATRKERVDMAPPHRRDGNARPAALSCRSAAGVRPILGGIRRFRRGARTIWRKYEQESQTDPVK